MWYAGWCSTSFCVTLLQAGAELTGHTAQALPHTAPPASWPSSVPGTRPSGYPWSTAHPSVIPSRLSSGLSMPPSWHTCTLLAAHRALWPTYEELWPPEPWQVPASGSGASAWTPPPPPPTPWSSSLWALSQDHLPCPVALSYPLLCFLFSSLTARGHEIQYWVFVI